MSDEKQSVRIDARPEPIEIDKSRTAIIVVDMQNDFGSKGGMFDRARIDISMIRCAVGPTTRVLAAGRQAGMAYSTDGNVRVGAYRGAVI